MGLEWLYPGAPWLLYALGLGLLLDHLYPWHHGILLAVHPVHTAYRLSRFIALRGSGRAWGVLAWIVTVSVHMAAYAGLLYVSWRVSPLLWLLAAGYIVKVSCPLYPLFDAVERFRVCAVSGNWRCARRYAQWLVRRNVAVLDESHVVSAVVESLGESLVDGYTSPLTYYALAGPLGALFQRLVNTLDSALGYKTGVYRELGWFSARMDDIVNYLPARLTALCLVLASRIAGLDWRGALRSWRRWAGVTESPNAGHPMAALAGALGVWLEKPGFYTINPLGSPPTPGIVGKAALTAAIGALIYTFAAITIILAATLLGWVPNPGF